MHMSRHSHDFLIVGPVGAGKTTLVRRLHALGARQRATSTAAPPQPTVGTELLTLSRPSLTLLEVGGAMEPLWEGFLGHCRRGLLFVVDTSSACAVGAASVALLRLLSSEDPSNKRPLLLVLNQRDRLDALPEGIVRHLLRLDGMQETSRGRRISIHWTSGRSGDGVDGVLRWCVEELQRNPQASR